MTEMALHQPQNNLRDQMDFARTVVVVPKDDNGRAVGARSLLPEAYRDNPANVLLAVGLGSSMGLSPAESLYRIDVIQGKPTASAELIASNVRKAGHRLRVKGDETSCTATIIRVDDPDYEFTVTRDVAWATAMGLTSKDNYKKQPGTMLQWRAISAVARLACSEALYGVAYTPDEMDDAPKERSGGLAAALADETVTTVEQVRDEPPVAPPEPTEHDPNTITAAQLKKLKTCLGKVDLSDRDEALAYYQRVTAREVDSSKALSKWEAGQVIDDLERCERGEHNMVDPASLNDPALDAS